MDNHQGNIINLKTQTEQMLQNAVLITEMAMDLKERSLAGEKYVCYLRSLAVRAARAINAMKNSGKSFIVLAQKMANSAIKTMEMVPSGEASFQNLRIEYEKLLAILERELLDVDEHDASESISQEFGQFNLTALADKLRYLETKQKQSDPSFTPQPSNSRTFKPGEDEKYPENWSRESLIDLNNIVNLPPVPENIFIGLSPSRPVRSSSLSSLKSLRKVKLSLQRVAKDSSEDEEESGSEEMVRPVQHLFNVEIISKKEL
ncbi:UNVERIFIED_CONTAM: hypothetical protein PYX00_005409 [Menopon gallinae]|uniref:Uncharacterized protein n=1 Tax=Menopon gallinae TaxID=328185 RepID=A0AAW2HS32_9NEOP